MVSEMDEAELYSFVADIDPPIIEEDRPRSPDRWQDIVHEFGMFRPSRRETSHEEVTMRTQSADPPLFDAVKAYKLMKAGYEAPNSTRTYKKWEFPVNTTPKRMGSTVLRSYQIHAVNAMIDIWRKGRNPLLAHGMGLGKTVEIIGVHCVLDEFRHTAADPRPIRDNYNMIETSRSYTFRGRTLIVVPKNLIDHWIQDLGKHMNPAPSIHIHQGTGRDRILSIFELCEFEFVITTYNVLCHEARICESTVASERGYGKFPLFGTKWDLVVLDEAQTICNPKTITAQASYLLDARLKTAITGTPLQNQYEDVQSLMAFLEIDPWNNFTYFKDHFVRTPLPESISGPGMLNMQLSAILALSLRAFVIRLTKNDRFDGRPIVNYHPGSGPIVVRHEMTDEQIEIQEVLKLQWNHVYRKKKLYDEMGRLSKGAKSAVEKVLALMLKARLCLVHMACMDAGYSGYADQDNLPDDVKVRVSLKTCRDRLFATVKNDYHSPRIDWILDAVRVHLRQDHGKIIIFSEFLCALDVIAVALTGEGRGADLLRYDGTCNTEEKKRAVELFADPSGGRIILITIRSGGVGLSFTAATMVIHMTPCWNPHLADQGTDRAIRPGQTREVYDFHLKCDDSIEDKIFAMHSVKRSKSTELYDPCHELRQFMNNAGQWSEDQFIEKLSYLAKKIRMYHEQSGSKSRDGEIPSISELNADDEEALGGLLG